MKGPRSCPNRLSAHHLALIPLPLAICPLPCPGTSQAVFLLRHWHGDRVERRMTKLSLVLAAATAVFGTASAWGFKKPCIPDVDICGWALQSDYGW